MPHLTLTQKRQLNQLSDFLKHRANTIPDRSRRTAYVEAFDRLQAVMTQLTGEPALGICCVCGNTTRLSYLMNQGGACVKCIATANER